MAVAPLPCWDGERRELCFAGQVVKRFKVPAPNQEAVLAALQEEGWPAAVDDPLPPAGDQDPKYRLRQTIRGLNTNQQHPVLRFRGDGSGERVLWERAAVSPQDAAVARRAA